MSFLKQNEKRTGSAAEVHKLVLHLDKPKGTVRADSELPINFSRFLNKYKKRKGSVQEVPFVHSYTALLGSHIDVCHVGPADDLLTFWTYLFMRSAVTVSKMSDWHGCHAVVAYACSDDQQQHGDTQSTKAGR